MTRASLIALDWGTSSFRAYLLNPQGNILQSKSSSQGILNVAENDFEKALEAQIGTWLDEFPRLPLLACGMIGSRQGWKEIPYVQGRAGSEELAAALGQVMLKRGVPLWIVPGLQSVDAQGLPDVMRGEETQVVGGLDSAKEIFVLPGTHSKWVICAARKIRRFSTFMTGELYQILTKHSILGTLFESGDFDAEAFGHGLKTAGLNQFSGLLHNLFSTRTLGLTHQLTSVQLPSYLSGLLIGSELLEAKTWMGAETSDWQGKVKLIGRAELTPLYQKALKELCGWESTVLAENSVVQGLYRVALHAQVVR